MTSTSTRSTLRIFVLAMFLSGLATAGFAEPPAKYKGNGAYISVSGLDTSGCIRSYVFASKGGTTTAPQTWIFYDVYNECSSQTIAWGSGLIANTALKVGNKTASLVVTPSQGADFYMEGEVGSIKLTVTADGLYSYTFSGHVRYEYADYVSQSHGSWTARSVTMTGTVSGLAQVQTSGYPGQARDKIMEFERGSK